MLASERHQRILSLLQEQGAVTILQLSQLFQVSEMTIHRDLEHLSETGRVRRVRGGAVSTVAPEPIIVETAASDRCLMCYKQPRRQTQVMLQLADGTYRRACCPHCGLMRMAQGDVVAAMVTGFLHGRTLSAPSAHYLINPEINICCTPTILAFECHKDALRFQKGFGGQIYDLYAAIAHLQDAMKLRP